MRPKLITSLLIFISAYSPLFLIFAVKDFDFEKAHKFVHPQFIYSLLSVTIFSVVLLFLIIKYIKRGNMPVKIILVKNRSVDLVNYTIPYIISFFGIDLSKPSDSISIGIFLLIMLLLTITTKSIFLNPILSLAGYGLYDLEYEFDGRISTTVILSKSELYSGERYYIRSLSRFLYIIKEKKED